MRKMHRKVVLVTTTLSILLLCTSCSNNKTPKDVDLEEAVATTDSTSTPDEAYYYSKLTEVRSNFEGIYSSQALGEDTLLIEEAEIDAETSMGASIKRFLNKAGEPLRYIITYYGETGQRQIDYYIDDFGLFVSEINVYYASKSINAEYMDPLYTEVENYCLKDGNVYEMINDRVIKSDKVFNYTEVQQLDDLYNTGEIEDIN